MRVDAGGQDDSRVSDEAVVTEGITRASDERARHEAVYARDAGGDRPTEVQYCFADGLARAQQETNAGSVTSGLSQASLGPPRLFPGGTRSVRLVRRLVSCPLATGRTTAASEVLTHSRPRRW
jgi:hypothetical protein